jgi:hypothetical protein
MQLYTVYYIWKLLYMFRVVLPPIVRSANNCIYSIWYLSDHYCYLLLKWQVAVTVWQIPDAVDTVVYAPDDGWRYHPKQVEHFPDTINCVTLHLLDIYWNILTTHEPMNVKHTISTPKNSLYVFKQQACLLHFEDMLHNLFHYPQNAIYFIILCFSVQTILRVFHKLCANYWNTKPVR